MKELIKTLYKAKISFIFYFSIGYSEFATPIAVVRDVGIVLTVLKVLFKVSFSWLVDVSVCIGCFLIFYIIGKILIANGMTQFANRLSNSVNPELELINKIWEKVK